MQVWKSKEEKLISKKNQAHEAKRNSLAPKSLIIAVKNLPYMHMKQKMKNDIQETSQNQCSEEG
eukprot:snap_masked-scaffold_8-processed-gene-13.30-mRNA-1 protein AED:1.00 eAED:1.00 QI:0/-1/0/0/-1/1/1/0/63